MKHYSTDPIRTPRDKNDEVYPCADCGVLRSEHQGGRSFTVCDKCWIEYWKKKEAKERP